jgi:hypothetical protein
MLITAELESVLLRWHGQESEADFEDIPIPADKGIASSEISSCAGNRSDDIRSLTF